MKYMDRMKFYISLLLILLLIPVASSVASAVEPDYYAQVNTSLNITDTCSVNGDNNARSCNKSQFACNISVVNPNRIIIANQINASIFGDYYYITLNASENSETGIYEVLTYCSNQTNYGNNLYYYEVTKTGEKLGESQTILVWALFMFSGLLFLIGFIMDNKNWVMKLGLHSLSLLMGVLSINTARIIAVDSPELSIMSQTGLVTSIIITSFIFMYLLVLYTIETIRLVRDSKNKKGVVWR
jgi:hypothetical protein